MLTDYIVTRSIHRGKNNGRESLAIKRFSDLCNTFGDHDEEIANAILVDEKNKKHFLMLAAGCMASLGYAGECEKRMQREHWDLRNKAATEYCLEHLETLIVCLCAESLPACELPWKSRRSNRNTRLCKFNIIIKIISIKNNLW